ncbi:MAG: hypothetical protein U0414_02350 [Polyangiaceae bacterium]
MRIRIDIEIGTRAKRLLTGLVLTAATGVVASAHADWQADVSWIKPNLSISATKLAALFEEAGNRLTALENGAASLETDVTALKTKLVVTKNGKKWSLGATYCGETAPTDGSAGGYTTTKTLCEQPSTGCVSTSAHVCTGEELLRSVASGIPLPSGGWYNGGTYFGDINGIAIYDCGAWASAAANVEGSYWAGGSGPTATPCNGSHPILCCD